MDINEAIRYFARDIDDDLYSSLHRTACKMAVDALRAQLAAEKNDPLTLDELLEMDGQPVWVVPGNDEPLWCIVGCSVNSRLYCCRGNDYLFYDEDYAVCGVINDDCEWIAYRRPPEED